MHISPWMYNTYESHIYLTVKRSVIVHFHSLLLSTGSHDDYGPLSQKSRNFSGQGHVSRKSRELFGPEKPFVKLRPAYSVKLVFSYVVKGIKIKITANFRASRRLRFEDTENYVTRNTPEKFRDFRETGPRIQSVGACNSSIFGSSRFHRPTYF